MIIFSTEDSFEKEDELEEESFKTFEMPKMITDQKEVEEITREASGSVKKTFTKGKFIASKSGKTFHKPRCDWAKKINRKNRVWLVDEFDAKDKGYKKHSCF